MLLQTVLNHPLGVARDMDRLFESMLSGQPLGFVPSFRPQWPAINVWEDQDHIYAEAELPGLKKEDIEVFVTDEELTISGSRTINLPEDVRSLRRERAIGKFERSISLPVPIDSEHVETRLQNGVLNISLPKVAAVTPRKIDVKALPASE